MLKSIIPFTSPMAALPPSAPVVPLVEGTVLTWSRAPVISESMLVTTPELFQDV